MRTFILIFLEPVLLFPINLSLAFVVIDQFHCHSVKRSEKGVDLIGSLCHIYDTSEDEIKRTLEKANNVIAEILGGTPRPASECKVENLENIDTGRMMSHI